MSNEPKYKTYEEVRANVPSIQAMHRQASDPTDMIVELANEREVLIERLMELDAIAPRVITAGFGVQYIYRCPDRLVIALHKKENQ